MSKKQPYNVARERLEYASRLENGKSEPVIP